MSTKELFRQLDEQTEVFEALFKNIAEEEPDEWDKEMIERGRSDTSEGIPFDRAVAELGFDINAL